MGRLYVPWSGRKKKIRGLSGPGGGERMLERSGFQGGTTYEHWGKKGYRQHRGKPAEKVQKGIPVS